MESVETLGKHIEEVFTNFPQHQPLTLEGLQSEWVEVKNMMKMSFSMLSMSEFIQKFVNLYFDSENNQPGEEQKETAASHRTMEHPYPNFAALSKLYLAIPISSVDCERGFSTYNLIKSSVRNRLNVSTVNTLMQKSVETPNLTDIERFNFEKAFEHWCGMKAHRTHRLQCV